MVNACTIIARNYAAHARVLADSFQAHHPGGRFTVLLVDDEQRDFDESGQPFSCLRLSDIGLEVEQITRLAAIYDVTELSTAVKPRFLHHLLKAGPSEVIYLDPDIRLYRSLEEAASLARQYGIVLTPHTIAPFPRDRRGITDFHILAAGVYNLGFIAVGAGAAAFIDWWWERTQREACVDPTRMMFTDQRWVDFVPSFFEHSILKDPTYNVAYWNLHEREVTSNGDGYLVNGRPLTFFHFSGFDGRTPHLLSKHQGDRPRILLSERPVVARLCREYSRSLEQAGLARVSALPYRWNTLPSGLPFDQLMRRLYREALDAFEAGRGSDPPNPFDPGGEDRFIDWLQEPVAGGLRPTISRYLYAIYEARADLRSAFPNLAGRDGQNFLEWTRNDGVIHHSIPASLLPKALVGGDEGRVYAPPSRLTDGVNIVGYFRAEVGVGEAARLLTAAIDAAGVPHSTLAYDATPSRKAHPFRERGDPSAPHDVNIVCVNADQTPAFARAAGPRFFEGRHTAGYWFWELEQFPHSMHHAFDYVDEVWTATDFTAAAVRAIGRRPVYTVPLPIPIPVCSPDVTRNSLQLPTGFMFLFVFDFFSILERKNPIGLIKAFQLAFRSGEGPTLVIKTINGDSRLGDLERVRAACGGRPDILIIDQYYSAEEKNSLLGLCDCYVSLHRSEGLGLTMAEAMGLEKPVIATGYSGNLHFMTAENSYLVDYSVGAVPAGCEPYPVGSPWAEPNLVQAAELMRRVYEAREEAAKKAAMGRRDIMTKHNSDKAADVLKQRLDDIHRGGRQAGAARQPELATVAGAVASMAPGASLVESLDGIARQLTPTTSVAANRRLRGPLRMAQEVLFRVLRPYWWQQRQVQTSLISVLRESVQATARVEQSERHSQQTLEALWAAVHALEGSAQSTSAFQNSAARHLQALTEQLASVTMSNDVLHQRLYAVPYMDDPGRFLYADEQGRNILGFRTRRGSNGGVYSGFEDVFRGSESFIRDRFRVYLPLLRGHDRVVDVGCGRGELLDLLRDEGVPAVGIDTDAAMVRRCRAKGHNVEQMDGLSYLRAQPDASLSAIVASQVVEHLPYDDLMSFLEVSRSKLKDGGRLIFETVNPHALEAFKTFWTDLTHQRPIFPEVAVVLCWLLDFDQAFVLFPNGSGDLNSDRATRGEYAVVATKGGLS